MRSEINCLRGKYSEWSLRQFTIEEYKTAE